MSPATKVLTDVMALGALIAGAVLSWFALLRVVEPVLWELATAFPTI